MRERFLPKAFPLLPYLALSAAFAVAGEIVYRYQVTLGLAVFALGIIPIILTIAVMFAFKPWVSVRPEGLRWRYLWGQEATPWSALRRIGRVDHPAGGFRLYAEVAAASFQTCTSGRIRRGLAGPSGAGSASPDTIRVWLPVGKLMHFCRVGSTRNLPAALKRLNPTLEMSERGLDGAWGRYRLIVAGMIAAWVAVIMVLGIV